MKKQPQQIHLIQPNFNAVTTAEERSNFVLEKVATVGESGDYLVFPEGILNFNLEDSSQVKHKVFYDVLKEKIQSRKINVLIGYDEKTSSGYFNKILALEKSGRELSFYKQRLMPFGETNPFSFVGKISIFPQEKEMTSGVNKVETINGLNFLVFICFESMTSQSWRELHSPEVDVVINPTNESWFPEFGEPNLALSSVVFKAVSFNQPIYRVGLNGITTFIDNQGNVHDPIGPGEKGVLSIPLNTSSKSLNFYQRNPWLWAKVILILTVLQGLYLFIIRKKNEEHS